MGHPGATYRLQVRPSWDLDAAAATCGHLAAVGADTVYLSPLLPSAHGSEHGYDVVRFDTVDPQRGSRQAWEHLLEAAREHDLSIVVDIVPNHTGVADAAENPAWWDMLRLGQQSPFARWFDIDWARGRVLLPVLGDDFTPDQLRVDGDELHYFEHRFPIAPETGPGPGETAADVHDRQHYELANFRRADTEQNYRRFFAVSTLAGLRVEDPEVFAATHEQIRTWLREDGIDGLRIDHPDGLVDPKGYLDDLRELAGDQAWIVVEKILESGEELPADWDIAGTTGYDALAEVCGVFVDTAGERPLDRTYRDLTGDGADLHEHVRRGKSTAATTILHAEVLRLARLVPGVDRAEDALTELLVSFPVYRSYLPTGAVDLAAAIEAARHARPDLADPIGALASRLADAGDELAKRFQQTSGAVMAKGVEDTAFYRYTRFIALNEVGGDPSRFGVSPQDFHECQRRRLQTAPEGMTTLSTHDTKRGEDVRARLAVLAEMPEQWRTVVARLMTAAPIPEPTFAYLLWQTFAGAGLIARDRMHAYAEKAMREAAIATTWLDPDPAFEATVHDAVDAAYDRPEVHDPLAELIEQITPFGWTNSLGQKLVQLTMPGVPDVYQGTEVWEDSLVDPDNRRPVDLAGISAALARLDDGGAEPPAVGADGLAKLWVTTRALRLRRARPEAFTGYTARAAAGAAAGHLLAFDRGGAITVATRLPVGLAAAGGWGDTVLDLGGPATDELTGRQVPAQVPVAELLSSLPVALLVR